MPVNKLLPVSADWKPEPKYRCIACGDVSRMHPETNRIWGCLTCGMTTAAVSVYFQPPRCDDPGNL